MVDFFVQGGGFMWPILIALLFGLAIIGERAYSLINSSSDTDQFFEEVKTIYSDSGREQAIEFCENSPGPVASIFYAGLSKMDKTKEEVEKAVQNEFEKSLRKRSLSPPIREDLEREKRKAEKKHLIDYRGFPALRCR